MYLKRFRATDFRNIGDCDIEFCSGVNLLIGRNAQGKTNCMEGIYTFSRGRSFRGCDEKEMIAFGKDGFHLRLDYVDKLGEESLEYSVMGRERQRKKNGYRVKRMSEFIGSFRSVLFYPDNLTLVKGGPEERRSFMNIAVCQCFPDYVPDYSVMKQSYDERNGLLRSLSKGDLTEKDQLYAWSYSLAEYSSHVFVRRRDYINALAPYVTSLGLEMSSGKERVEVSYKNDIARKFAQHLPENERDGYVNSLSRAEVSNFYLKMLTENTEKEIKAGTTLYGPLRDDLNLTVNGLPARIFCSQGQQRSVVLAMKLAEGEVIKEMFNEYPVYLFDDVLSELDSERRKFVIEGMRDRQIIISTCEGDATQYGAGRVITVENGAYVGRDA